MREKISRLELALAQTSDSKQRQGVKNLLDEAILEQNAYYLEKAELERQERRRQIIYNIFLGLILIILAFVAFSSGILIKTKRNKPISFKRVLLP